MRPWLTVVTVVKDDAAGFARSLASLSGQDLDGVEYVVIDSSADRDDAADALAHAGVAAALTWTEPAGIYAAMNAGLAQASGDFIYFLNAGDVLHDGVLATLRDAVQAHDPQWVLGDVEIVATDGTRTITPMWDYAAEQTQAFSRGLFPPHQGTAVRTDLLRSVGGFDTSYRIVADYAAFLRFSHIAPLRIDLVIASFSEGGTSTVRWQESVREFHRARVAILRPSGALAMREKLNTAKQFAALGTYRTLQRVRGN